MSDFPRPHHPSTTDTASRRGTAAAHPPPAPPVADAEQGARDTCEPSPVPTGNCPDEVARTLEVLATPQPDATSGMPKVGLARGGRALRPAATPRSPVVLGKVGRRPDLNVDDSLTIWISSNRRSGPHVSIQIRVLQVRCGAGAG